MFVYLELIGFYVWFRVLCLFFVVLLQGVLWSRSFYPPVLGCLLVGVEVLGSFSLVVDVVYWFVFLSVLLFFSACVVFVFRFWFFCLVTDLSWTILFSFCLV